MAKKLKDKGVDNTPNNDLDNKAGAKSVDTPNTSKGVKEADTPSFLDSDSIDIGASLTSILNVPTETITTEKTDEDKRDVLEGFGSPEPSQDKEGKGGGDFDDFTNLGGGEDSPFFEDNELLAQIGIELIDMMMCYGAMAIAKDFDNEDKYAIKDKRKKKLEEPLRKILENREVKTSPELVFAFMMIVTYSPVMITAVQERREKNNAKKQPTANPAPSQRSVITNPTTDNPSVMPSSKDDVEVGNKDDDALGKMLAGMQPKRKSGRPVGSTDLKPRKNLDDNERERQIEKAKALRKDGWSFARVGKELGVSEGTATRWIRSTK